MVTALQCDADDAACVATLAKCAPGVPGDFGQHFPPPERGKIPDFAAGCRWERPRRLGGESLSRNGWRYLKQQKQQQ